jgi:hypothetical protein
VGVIDVKATAKSRAVLVEKSTKSEEKVTVGSLPVKLPLPLRPPIEAGLLLNTPVRRSVLEPVPSHDAGATTPQGMTRRDLCRLITEAGRVPVERDTLYHAVTRTENTFTVAV